MLIATDTEVTELRGKGIDVLPGMVQSSPDHGRSASNHPDDGNATSLAADVKVKAAEEAKRAEELRTQQAEETAASADKTAFIDGKITAQELEARDAKRAQERKAREEAARSASTTSGSTTASGEQTTSTQQHPPKKSGFQQRIDELTRKAGESARARAEAEAKAAQYKKEADEARAALAKAQGEKAPQRGDFDTEDAYNAALVSHTAKVSAAQAGAAAQEAAARSKEQDAVAAVKQAEQSASQAALEQFTTRQEEARLRYADFDKVALREDVKLSPALAVMIMTSELGADVQYFLGQHPEEAARISALGDPLAVAREIGGIERTLSANVKKWRDERAAAEAAAGGATTSASPASGRAEAPSTSGRSAVSAAPAPLSTPSGRGTGDAVVTYADASKMSMAEYHKARAEGRIR